MIADDVPKDDEDQPVNLDQAAANDHDPAMVKVADDCIRAIARAIGRRIAREVQEELNADNDNDADNETGDAPSDRPPLKPRSH